MGLWDRMQSWWGGSPGSGPSGDLPQPRCQHYEMAHRALRFAAMGDPLGFLAVVASPQARQLMTELWGHAAEFSAEQGERPDFSVDDIRIHPGRVGNRPCAVFEFPRPRATAEAWFTAAVGMIDLSEGTLPERTPELRYFTLEKGFVLSGPPRTVLGEWTSDGAHLNYGDGPAPDLRSFVAALEDMMSGRGGK